MTLKQWFENSWLRQHKTKPSEISDLLQIVDRDFPLILGENRKDDAQYLDVCRSKRNIVEYDQIGAVSEQDADELIEFCCELREDVLKWLRESYPEL